MYEICKQCDYKNICAGECEITIEGLGFAESRRNPKEFEDKGV